MYGAAVNQIMDHKVFPIARGSAAALWFCGVIGVFLLGIGAMFGTLTFFGSRIVTVEVSDQGVRVHGDMYGRFIPRASLQVNAARVLDLGAEPGFAPVSRTNGTGLPNLIVICVYTDRGSVRRIISLRRAKRRERNAYRAGEGG